MTETTTSSSAPAQDDDESVGNAFRAGGRRTRGAAAGALPPRPGRTSSGRPPAAPTAEEGPDRAEREQSGSVATAEQPESKQYEADDEYEYEGDDQESAEDSDAGDGRRPVSVTIYARTDLVRRIEHYQDKKKRELNVKAYENGRVVLDAFMTVDEEQIKAIIIEAAKPKKKSRFVPMAPAKAAEEVNRPGWHFTFLPDNVAAVDDLVTEIKSRGVKTNRSAVCCAAMDLYLPQMPQKKVRKRKTEPTAPSVAEPSEDSAEAGTS